MFEYLCKKSVSFYCVYFLIVLQHHLAVKICPSLRNFNRRSNYTLYICCVRPKQKGFSFAHRVLPLISPPALSIACTSLLPTLLKTAEAENYATLAWSR